MNSVKTIATTAAFVLALSGAAFAQGSLGNSGNSGTAGGSAVESAPSAVETSKGAAASAPASGSGFGSTGSTDSSLTTPNGNPAPANPATGGIGYTIDNNGVVIPANPTSR